MSKNILNEVLDREIRGAKQTPSVEDAVAVLTGKDKRSIPKPVQKRTDPERAAKIAALKAKRDGVAVGGSEEVEHIKHIPEIDQIPEIPAGFPEGTILNDDGSLSLPDGRRIRKIKQEVDHE